MNPRYVTILIATAMAAVLSTSVMAKNGNGEKKAKVTKEERAVKRAEHKAKILKEFDKDGDGKLSKEERTAAKDARKKQLKERKGKRKNKGKNKGNGENADKAAE